MRVLTLIAAAQAIGTRAPITMPMAPNDRWQLTDGPRFLILTVVDD